MHDDEQTGKKTARYMIGADLERLSVEELQALIATLAQERMRVETALERKQASLRDANSFFK